jgi:UDP-N-acetylmuramoyl-tripeptide--D-alanyl-D-alanine ligase
MLLSFVDIAKILGTAAPSEPNLQTRGYSIDSRTLRRGELFFAVRGKKLDGHDFVQGALAAGASGAVVDASRKEDYPAAAQTKLLAVPNGLEALQKLAAAVRSLWGGPLVAVTGSTGKTTTKQMIAALLGTRLRVLQSEGNLNNQYGLPLSLLRLTPETDVGVFELGMSAPGEIRFLSTLAAPDVAVVTNVSGVHLEFFPDVEAIARAKYEIIETLSPGAWAVLNADDDRVRAWGEAMADQVLYFGISHPAHFQAKDLEQTDAGDFVFRLSANPFQGRSPGSFLRETWGGIGTAQGAAPEAPFRLPLLGRHNVLNLLAAFAVCDHFGIPPDSLRDAVAALRPAPMRGEKARLPNGALAVNDCYNSSPAALESMLEALAALPAKRRFAVLGGMMELGPASESLHQRAGSRVAELKFDGLFTVGEPARPMAEGARASGMGPEALVHFDSPAEAGARLKEILQEGDVVLLKASRAVHLETVWEQITAVAKEGQKAAGSREAGGTKEKKRTWLRF